MKKIVFGLFFALLCAASAGYVVAASDHGDASDSIIDSGCGANASNVFSYGVSQGWWDYSYNVDQFLTYSDTGTDCSGAIKVCDDDGNCICADWRHDGYTLSAVKHFPSCDI